MGAMERGGPLYDMIGGGYSGALASRPRSMNLDDPKIVREEYATEDRFLARKLANSAQLAGPDVDDEVLRLVAQGATRRVLDAGCGTGDVTAKLAHELQVSVVGLDLSARMVELTLARGLDAHVGDVHSLPFANCDFDCVVANRILYHLKRPERALSELARVLRSQGRMIATLYGRDHVRELWALLGERPPSSRFATGDWIISMRRHFRYVSSRDLRGRATFTHQGAIEKYLEGFKRFAKPDLVDRLPDVSVPFVAHFHHVIIVANEPLRLAASV
jgi:SAM-dependent methyltransferase